MTGFELLKTIGDDGALRDVPVVVYTGKELSRKEVTQLRRLAQSVIVKDARSPERLLDETALFLHRRVTGLSKAQRSMLTVSYDTDDALAGKKVLIIDDDVRNIFALTTVLERQQMSVFFSENGKDGIELLDQAPGIDIVLMDIMMPEMDGYDTTRAIRADPRFSRLPIITLTAKAMKGDREKCIEAGASDYITKPVDTGRLISLLRVWLSPKLGALA
jgi:CheY-like chemotaxis protein